MPKQLQIVSRADAKARDIRKYFTGKACKYGHFDERHTSDAKCVTCKLNYMAKWRELNYEHRQEYKKKRRQDPEILEIERKRSREYSRKYYQNPENRERQKKNEVERMKCPVAREKKRKRDKRYFQRVKEKNRRRAARYQRIWGKTVRGKAIRFMRNSLHRCLRGETKPARTEEILGYSRWHLIDHIERQFDKGMSWDNYGEWHIDHITPVAWFIDSNILDPAKINCLSNLRPVWASDNMSKSASQTHLL